IGPACYIRRAIIDKNARIGSDVHISNEAELKHFDAEDGSYCIRDGIVIVPKNAVLPDGTVI
ncbi:MAG TPA: glucose-1-phosphate adenylyltransferase, partial [Blastocatellia bacterium]|nr:glucose-1-phosphate adenylyltransferase [Blastocatellia bacterium]